MDDTTHNLCKKTKSRMEVNIMASYIAPAVQARFETLSVNLKNQILEKNVRIENVHDLIHVLEQIVAEGEG